MFVGAALATVLAGWRSGVIAVAVGEVLTWYLIVLPRWAFSLPSAEVRTGLILATLSQLITVLIIALYQREVDKGTAEREHRLELLDHALREIDHRTANNYQTVLALIDLQARRASDPQVREALSQVRDRIQAIANASQQLAVRSDDLDAVRLDEYLCRLVQQIERGLARDGIAVNCEVEEVTASSDAATSISIIVNELVTNAIKHAFNGEGSGQVRVIGRTGSAFELIVSDDGRGIQASRRDGHQGLGSNLVERFARQLGARHEVVSTNKGTEHRLHIPRLD
jgi:two-component sensor histidine kinase